MFVLYASEVVEDEAARGERAIAAQRLNLLRSLMLLELTEEAFELSQAFLSQSNLPPKASNRAIFNDLKQKQLAHKDRLVKLPIKRLSKAKNSLEA